MKAPRRTSPRRPGLCAVAAILVLSTTLAACKKGDGGPGEGAAKTPEVEAVPVEVAKAANRPIAASYTGTAALEPLAESLGSTGAYYTLPEGYRAVGLDINANHLRSATSGWVTGTARPVHIGRTTHVWHIDLHNETGELTCVSRLTMAILAPR